MKEITREQIDETVSKVVTEAGKDVCKILLENIETYEKDMDDIEAEEMKQYSLYIATMNTALQMSVSIMRESLYELLCED